MTELLPPKSWHEILPGLALERQSAQCLGHYTSIVTWSKSVTCPRLSFRTVEGQSNSVFSFLSACLGGLVHVQRLSLTLLFSLIQPCMCTRTRSVPVPPSAFIQ